MVRALVAKGKSLAIDEDFLAVLFLSLTGLDFSLWLLARGLFDVVTISAM